MNQPPRDWDRELADIDKVMEKQGSGAAGQGGSVGQGGVAPAARAVPATPSLLAPARRQSVALTWFWTLLALALAIALPLWPYERGCGLRLGFFLGATGITLLAGFLGALASWANRRGLAHVLSLIVLVWATVVAAGEVLPRIGYARESRTWLCADAPAQPGPAPQATPPAAQSQ
jgi:hypothetical protein